MFPESTGCSLHLVMGRVHSLWMQGPYHSIWAVCFVGASISNLLSSPDGNPARQIFCSFLRWGCTAGDERSGIWNAVSLTFHIASSQRELLEKQAMNSNFFADQQYHTFFSSAFSLHTHHFTNSFPGQTSRSIITKVVLLQKEARR